MLTKTGISISDGSNDSRPVSSEDTDLHITTSILFSEKTLNFPMKDTSAISRGEFLKKFVASVRTFHGTTTKNLLAT